MYKVLGMRFKHGFIIRRNFFFIFSECWVFEERTKFIKIWLVGSVFSKKKIKSTNLHTHTGIYIES